MNRKYKKIEKLIKKSSVISIDNDNKKTYILSIYRHKIYEYVRLFFSITNNYKIIKEVSHLQDIITGSVIYTLQVKEI